MMTTTSSSGCNEECEFKITVTEVVTNNIELVALAAAQAAAQDQRQDSHLPHRPALKRRMEHFGRGDSGQGRRVYDADESINVDEEKKNDDDPKQIAGEGSDNVNCEGDVETQ